VEAGGSLMMGLSSRSSGFSFTNDKFHWRAHCFSRYFSDIGAWAARKNSVIFLPHRLIECAMGHFLGKPGQPRLFAQWRGTTVRDSFHRTIKHTRLSPELFIPEIGMALKIRALIGRRGAPFPGPWGHFQFLAGCSFTAHKKERGLLCSGNIGCN